MDTSGCLKLLFGMAMAGVTAMVAMVAILI
jgi:hypothetical protein